MAFKKHSEKKITHLQSQAAKVVSALDKIREEMRLDEVTEVDLQLGKAVVYLDWLQEWAIDMEAAAEKMATRRAARELLAEVEAGGDITPRRKK